MIAVEGLVKTYGRRRVLDGVSFEARAGRVTALLGANGAGKTTVLRVLLGVARPTSGRATIDGRPLAEHPGPARVAGFAPSGRVGPPGRGAAEQARLVAAVAGLGPDAAARALEDVGLGSAARRRAGTYSTGMHRRMALALALLGHPAALVLDEPTNGLDPLAARGLWDRTAAWAAAGGAVLLATHALADALARADDVVILRAGRASFAGPVAAVGGTDRALGLLGGGEAL